MCLDSFLPLSLTYLGPYLETNDFHTIVTLCEHWVSFYLSYILSCRGCLSPYSSILGFVEQIQNHS